MTGKIENLSAYVICKDEAGVIEACLRSLSVCAEIVVVDSGSTDGTLEIVRRLAAEGLAVRLFERDWPGYARQKQFALEQCTREWAICLDADERLSSDLIAALPDLVSRPDVAGWRIPRTPFLYGYGYAGPGRTDGRLVRLTRTMASQYDLEARVHESMMVEGRIATVGTGMILHRRALPLGEQILKENAYSTLKAEQLHAAGVRPRLARLVLNPPVYFLKTYLARRFFLCGWPGFIHAATAAIYSFLTEAKLLQMHLADRNMPDADGPAHGHEAKRRHPHA